MSSLPRLSLMLALVCFVVALLMCGGCPPRAPQEEVLPGVVPPPAEPSGPPLKIGAIFSVTGTAGAPLGTPEKETVLMLAEQINARGGIAGRPVEVLLEDDQSDNTQAASAAKKLLDQQVSVVIGPTLSGTTLAIVDTFEKAQVPLVSCAASIKITQPVKKWVFSTAQPDVLAVERLMEYLKTKNITKIAVVYDSNPFGKSGMEVLDKHAPENGVKIVASESFASKDTDMTTQLTKCKQAGPEAIVCWGTNPGPAIVAKNMKTLKMGIPLLMSHGVANQSFLKLSGEAAEGVVLPAGKLLLADALPASDPQRSILTGYASDFMTKYQKPADTFGGHAYDAFQVVVAAMEAAGDDPAKLRDAIEATQNFIGISGIFNMSPTDHNGLTKDAFEMVTVKNGTWAPAS